MTEQQITSESTLEHLRRCPNNYIGPNNIIDQDVYLVKDDAVVHEKIDDFCEALLHLFKEVIDNAADNIKRPYSTPQSYIKIQVNKKSVQVTNDGKPIPVTKETIEIANEITKKKEKVTCYRTQGLFNYFRTGTNAVKSKAHSSIGTNGIGTKAVIGVSKHAKIHHSDPESGQQLEMEWKNGMTEISEPVVKPYKNKGVFTTFYYEPDWKWFKLKEFSDNHIGIMHCMSMCLAYVTGLKVTFNDKVIKVPNITSLGKLFFGERKSMELTNDSGDKVLIMEQTLEEMEEHGVRFVSFVNSSSTRSGGVHVNYNANKIGKEIATLYGNSLKQDDAKKFFIYIVNYHIDGEPDWSGQTKAELLGPKNLKRIDFEKKDAQKIKKWNVWAEIGRFLEGKINKNANKATKTMTSYIGALPKEATDAFYAGSKDKKKRDQTELYICEGLSAKSLIDAGLKYRKSSDFIGILALRGKINNVQKMEKSDQTDAKFLSLIRKMIGLKMGCKYEKEEDASDLRYRSIIIATDKDHDGRHILALVYGFFQLEHPGLIENGIVTFLETPVIKTVIGKEVHRFYLREDFTEWLDTLPETKRNAAIKNRKFIKGLGGNNGDSDAKFIFKESFLTGSLTFGKQRDKDLLKMFFGKNDVLGKKDFMFATFYNDEWVHVPKKGSMTFTEFVEHVFTGAVDEQIHRAIPFVYDGLIESKKDILWTALHYLKKQTKTVQFASSVATHSSYDHGEQNLPPTVTKMTQNIIGQNNIIVFKGDGIFGNRYQDTESKHGAAAERYTYLEIQPLMREIFRVEDDPILEYEEKDGRITSPKYFLPIIPWFAVNGILQTVANTFSTSYPSYNPDDLIKWIKHWIHENYEDAPEAEGVEMVPWFRGFRGKIEKTANGWLSRGICKQIDDNTWEIDEIAAGKWGSQMQTVLEKLADDKKIEKPRIMNLDANTCKAIIKTKQDFDVTKSLESVLTNKMPMTNVTLIHDERPMTSDNIEDHLVEYAIRRYQGYIDRRKYHLAELTRELQIKNDKIKYIKLVIDGTINFKKITDTSHLIKVFGEHGFKPVVEKEEEEEDQGSRGWKHLLSVTMVSATKKSIERLENEKNVIEEKYTYFKTSKAWRLWLDDLEKFKVAYDEYCKENPMNTEFVSAPPKK